MSNVSFPPGSPVLIGEVLRGPIKRIADRGTAAPGRPSPPASVSGPTFSASAKHVDRLCAETVAAAIQKHKVQTLTASVSAKWKTAVIVAEERIAAGRFIRLSARGMKLAHATGEVCGICTADVNAGESAKVVMEGEVGLSSWDVEIPVGGRVGCGPDGWLKAAGAGESSIGVVSSAKPAMTFDLRFSR